MENEIVKSENLSVRDLKSRINLIQEVMRGVMDEGIHYGTIPGCPKPSLFKAGAEKLASTFRISVQSNVEDLSGPDEKRFRVSCSAVAADGSILGSAVGECSSSEEKYRWKRPVCEAEYEATPGDRKRIKWDRDGKETKQIRTEPADLANTILQMADKRAYVAVVRKVTAASDIFTQDIEDLDGIQSEGKPTFKKPQPSSAAMNPAEFKPMKSKFSGKCKKCDGAIAIGQEILYNKSLGVFHPDCLKPEKEPEPQSPVITKPMLTNLVALAKKAGINLIDRLGADGFETIDQIVDPAYVQELMTEFAGVIDERA